MTNTTKYLRKEIINMKKVLKKFLVAALVLSLTLSGTLTAFGADDAKGIKVQYNGKDITFTNASPKIIDGKTMVPFREIFETMGAVVTYDSKTKTILAKTEDKEFSFAIGGTDITIIENGTKLIKKMDVVPFVDKNSSSTYIPVRFIAESMGCGVGWDSTEKTVIIIDPATLSANADEDFSIISKLLTTDLDLEKAYETTGQFDVDVTTYEDKEAAYALPGMNFSVTGKMSGVQQKSDADLIMSLVVNADKMLSTLSAEEKAQIQPILDMFKNTSMKIKMDGKTGVTYMNSDLFAALDPTLDKNTWYKMNVFEAYDDMGIDIRSMMDMDYSDVSISEILQETLTTIEYSDVATYQDMKTAYTFLKYLIGDDAFKTKTAGTFKTYTLDLNQASVIAALAKTALAEGISVDSLDMVELKDLLNDNDFSASFIIKDKGESLYSYDVKGTCSTEELNFAFNMSGDQKNTKVGMTMDQKDLMKMIMNVESHISETSKVPDLELPADAKVVDFPM